MFYAIGDTPDWVYQAECNIRKDEVQTINARMGFDIFYPEKAKTVEAKRLSDRFCKTCPVQVECFQAGVGEYGTWGGETSRRRMQLVSTLNTSLSTLLKRLPEQSQGEKTPRNEESNPGLAAS